MKRILLIFGMVLLAMAGIRAQQRVKIHTTMGDIVVKLYDETPIHRDNFLKLVREGYYNGTLMHRVIRGFMIQGGDPNSKGAAPDKMLGGGSPDYTLEAEIREGLYHKRGALGRWSIWWSGCRPRTLRREE